MNILFLTTIKFNKGENKGLFADLTYTLSKKGHKVYVASPNEKLNGKETIYYKEDEIAVLKIYVGNISKVRSLFKKALSMCFLPYHYKKSINKYWNNIKFDLIIYATPPISFNRLIRKLKKNNNCSSYLMLKDIFPQNALDIQMISRMNPIYHLYRFQEKQLYKTSDYIGCMSQKNIEYLMNHNSYLDKNKIELFPNSIIPFFQGQVGIEKKIDDIRYEFMKKYQINDNVCKFIMGGNFGRPQGVNFIKEIIRNFHHVKKSLLVIIGSGTEFTRMQTEVKKKNYKNVILLNKINKLKYDLLIKSFDVGIITLDNRFTIPNFPSRILPYMDAQLPILAATDVNTDLREIIIENEIGMWCESLDINVFIRLANKLSENKQLRNELGLNSKNYLHENYNIENNINIMLNHFK